MELIIKERSCGSELKMKTKKKDPHGVSFGREARENSAGAVSRCTLLQDPTDISNTHDSPWLFFYLYFTKFLQIIIKTCWVRDPVTITSNVNLIDNSEEDYCLTM